MAQKKFETEQTAAAAYGFHQAALGLLEELAILRPDENYIESLRKRTLDKIKNDVPFGMPMEQERKYVEASLAAVEHVFDHIDWRRE